MAQVPAAWGDVRLANAGDKRKATEPIPSGDDDDDDKHRSFSGAKKQAVGQLLADSLNTTYDKLLNVVETRRSTGEDKMQRITHLVVSELSRLVSTSSFKKTFLHTSSAGTQPSTDLRPVPKAYEDANLRQKIHDDEHPCVRGEQCECMFIDPTQPFVGVTFRLPWEREQKPGLCLPCARAATLELLVETVCNNTPFDGLIQRFGNTHSEPGEYRTSAMLFCPPNGPLHSMPLPIVRHQRNNYRVHKRDGCFYLEQINVHFQGAP